MDAEKVKPLFYMDSKQKESLEAEKILREAGIEVDKWDLRDSNAADFEPPLLIASMPVFRSYSTVTEISSFTRMYKAYQKNNK